MKSAIQLYQFGIDGGRCDIALPDPRLNQYIDYYWLLSLDDTQVDLEVIPDMATDLVLSPTLPDFVALYPPVDEKFSIPLTGPIQFTGVCFRTSRFDRLFTPSLEQLRDVTPGVETIKLLEIEQLVLKTQGCDSLTALTTCFDAHWLEHIKSRASLSSKQQRLSQESILAAIQASLGTAGLESVCKTLNISDRQFRRLSQNMLGVTPKKIQSIFRLQAALSDLLATDPPRIEDLYYDDSHRVRELKKLTGLTPTQIRKMAEKYNQP